MLTLLLADAVQVDIPLSLLATVVGLALILGPHPVSWWKKHRGAHRR